MDTNKLYQLTKQGIADGEEGRHIRAIFHAVSAKKEGSAWYFGNVALSVDYFLAMFGMKAYEELRRKECEK